MGQETRTASSVQVQFEANDDDRGVDQQPPALNADPQREATELEPLSLTSPPSGDPDIPEPLETQAEGPTPRPSPLQRLPTGPVRHGAIGELQKIWRRHVSVIVPHEACRDHLALERTFLGYLRTASALAMAAVTIAQLFRLQQSPTERGPWSYYAVSTPLALACMSAALVVLLLGSLRFWRQQDAMVKGKIWTAGLEIHLSFVGILVLMIVMLAVILRVEAQPNAKV